jgi:hypothetical protein
MKPIQHPPPPSIGPDADREAIANLHDALFFLVEHEHLQLPDEVRDDLRMNRDHAVYRDGPFAPSLPSASSLARSPARSSTNRRPRRAMRLRLRAKVNVLVAFFAPVLDGIGRSNGAILTHAQIHHGEADRLPGTGYALNAVPIADTLKREGAATSCFPILARGTASSATIRTTPGRARFRSSEPCLSSNLVSDALSAGKACSCTASGVHTRIVQRGEHV